MNESFDCAPAAAVLLSAWRDGRQLSNLPPEIRPDTLARGYDVQDALIATAGDPIAGWKLGVGSPIAMRRAGIARPLIGAMLASHCHRSGDAVAIRQGRPVTIEFEIAFVLGRDIEPDAPAFDPLDAVSATHVGFELVLSRFTDRRAVGHPSFVGDNVGFAAFVLGAAIDRRQVAEVISSVSVEIDGVSLAHGLQGDELSDPVTALAYLVAHARERGITLRRGAIVTTGAAAQPIDVQHPEFDLAARYLDSELRAHVTTAR
jgi:2-keto-4-pentenoate hydratase